MKPIVTADRASKPESLVCRPTSLNARAHFAHPYALMPDDTVFESLQKAFSAGVALRLYILCQEEGTSYRVANSSVASVRVFLVGVCSISCLEVCSFLI